MPGENETALARLASCSLYLAAVSQRKPVIDRPGVGFISAVSMATVRGGMNGRRLHCRAPAHEFWRLARRLALCRLRLLRIGREAQAAPRKRERGNRLAAPWR